MRHVYFGTYTNMGKPSGSKGIYAFKMDEKTGMLSETFFESRCGNPSYITVCEKNGCLYAGSEQIDSAEVFAYRIDPDTGGLSFINSQKSEGSALCHISVDKDCRMLIASHYLSGNVTVFPLNEDGSLGEMQYNYQHHGKSIDPERQEAQHAHSTIFTPDEKIAYTADLGMDKIVLYSIDKEKGTVLPNDSLPHIKVSPGDGPRHFAFHPNGKYVYLSTEMGSSVIVYEYNPKTGNLEEKQKISTLPPGFTGMNLAADIHISGDGKHLYVSNRGHNSIVMYSVDPDTGLLHGGDYFPTLGNWPRFFAITPDGRFMIITNQLSDNATVFEIDPETGVLGEMIQNIDIPQPVCVAFF